MSETRYTPEQMREMADYLSINADPAAAMLRQAATDAEALAEVTAYLTHLLATVAPQCEPLPTAAGDAIVVTELLPGEDVEL